MPFFDMGFTMFGLIRKFVLCLAMAFFASIAAAGAAYADVDGSSFDQERSPYFYTDQYTYYSFFSVTTVDVVTTPGTFPWDGEQTEYEYETSYFFFQSNDTYTSQDIFYYWNGNFSIYTPNSFGDDTDCALYYAFDTDSLDSGMLDNWLSMGIWDYSEYDGYFRYVGYANGSVSDMILDTSLDSEDE